MYIVNSDIVTLFVTLQCVIQVHSRYVQAGRPVTFFLFWPAFVTRLLTPGQYILHALRRLGKTRTDARTAEEELPRYEHRPPRFRSKVMMISLDSLLHMFVCLLEELS